MFVYSHKKKYTRSHLPKKKQTNKQTGKFDVQKKNEINTILLFDRVCKKYIMTLW